MKEVGNASPLLIVMVNLVARLIGKISVHI